MKFLSSLLLFSAVIQPCAAQTSEPAPVPATLSPAPEAPAEEPVPAAKGTLLKSTKTPEYDIPLSFDPSESGVLMPPLEIDYDLTVDGGKTLRIGNLNLNAKTFVIVARPLKAFLPGLAGSLGEDADRTTLVIRWPMKLIQPTLIEMISRSGKVLWTREITRADLVEWNGRTSKWRAASGAAARKTAILGTPFGFIDPVAQGMPLLNQRESFRFCLTETEGRGSSKLCSQRMGVRGSGNALRLGSYPVTAEPRVVVRNENGALSGAVPVAADAPAQFYADLASGQSYEFLAEPPKLNLVDLAATSKPGVLRVSGFGVAPTNPHVILNKESYGLLTRVLGFEPTIGDQRKFWASALRNDSPQMFFPGAGGGIFRQRFELNDVPRTASRVHLSHQTLRGTYDSDPVLYGRKQPDSKIASQEYEAAQDPRDPSLFSWRFRAESAGELNKSYLAVTTAEGKTYKSFFEIHRAHSNELSLRTSGVIAPGGFVFVGEVAYNHWFENWFGWENYWITHQRWGVSARYFKSLNQLTVSDTEKASLDVMNADLKYRLSPGLWTRDESVGLMASYQSVTFGEIKAPMMGFGAFWARSMPRSIDGFFNYFPFMEYPKWVDMELIYYASSMKADVTLQNTMSLNFHGQVLWTKSFFGEAGFGYKRYGLTDVVLRKTATLDTIYGTVGLGLKF